MRRLRYSVPYIAGKNLPKDSDPAPRGAGQSCGTGRPNWPNFNPPAPCGAGRGRPFAVPTGGNFNPPAPCGAGHSGHGCSDYHADFNPPAPCGAGPRSPCKSFRSAYFNPPAPCGAGLCSNSTRNTESVFQSTRPLRGGTPDLLGAIDDDEISIHPPLAGRDHCASSSSIRRANFNPPAPCGAGPPCWPS